MPESKICRLNKDNRVGLGKLLRGLDKNELYIFVGKTGAFITDSSTLEELVDELGLSSTSLILTKEETEKMRSFWPNLYKLTEKQGTVYLNAYIRSRMPSNRFNCYRRGNYIFLDYCPEQQNYAASNQRHNNIVISGI